MFSLFKFSVDGKLPDLFKQQHMHRLFISKLRSDSVSKMRCVLKFSIDVKLPDMLEQQHMHIMLKPKLRIECISKMRIMLNIRIDVKLPDMHKQQHMHKLFFNILRGECKQQVLNMRNSLGALLDLQQSNFMHWMRDWLHAGFAESLSDVQNLHG
jgi:hypothetical protein